jgi:hypothetical protein
VKPEDFLALLSSKRRLRTEIISKLTNSVLRDFKGWLPLGLPLLVIQGTVG